MPLNALIAQRQSNGLLNRRSRYRNSAFPPFISMSFNSRTAVSKTAYQGANPCIGAKYDYDEVDWEDPD